MISDVFGSGTLTDVVYTVVGAAACPRPENAGGHARQRAHATPARHLRPTITVSRTGPIWARFSLRLNARSVRRHPGRPLGCAAMSAPLRNPPADLARAPRRLRGRRRADQRPRRDQGGSDRDPQRACRDDAGAGGSPTARSSSAASPSHPARKQALITTSARRSLASSPESPTYTVRSGSVVVRTGEADQEPKKVPTSPPARPPASAPASGSSSSPPTSTKRRTAAARRWRSTWRRC